MQNQTEKIHTHSLKKGIYILKLSKGNNSVQKKLIIK
ncbi:MAG: hypothetical protein C0594_17705 [Marinilabiliales bacterium]|nr:MAG: hypothetical protein C0594_17705 [Marinilabiliales bacterium]